MPYIPLTRGHTTILDDIDWEQFRGFRWHAHGPEERVYAARTFLDRKIFLHNEIMGEQAKGAEVDHINRDRLDNRRANLRITTHSGNLQNAFQKNNTSGLRGVSWSKYHKKWDVQFCNKRIGYFKSRDEAAYAYNKLAIETYGPHAYVNPLPDDFVSNPPVPRPRPKYKGVCWMPKRRKWKAAFGPKFIGYFDSCEDAALAYNQRALEIGGPDVYVNVLTPEFPILL